MQGNKIVDLAGPVLGTDAVNKNYVDTEVTAAKTALGYKSTQVFQWVNGSPVAYVNFPIGTTSGLPFDTTPLIETGTYSGAAGTFAWTCVNVAAAQPPSPTPVEAEFTLGASGAGAWEVLSLIHI